jgi:hypothetical protein
MGDCLENNLIIKGWGCGSSGRAPDYQAHSRVQTEFKTKQNIGKNPMIWTKGIYKMRKKLEAN